MPSGMDDRRKRVNSSMHPRHLGGVGRLPTRRVVLTYGYMRAEVRVTADRYISRNFSGALQLVACS
jgi:hypothetical protein